MSKNQTERAKQISAQTLFTAFRLIITAKRAHSLLISILGNRRYNKCCFEYGLIITISIQSILWWAPCRIQSFIVLLLSTLIDKVDSNVFCNNCSFHDKFQYRFIVIAKSCSDDIKPSWFSFLSMLWINCTFSICGQLQILGIEHEADRKLVSEPSSKTNSSYLFGLSCLDST